MARYNERHQEIPDPTPVAMPLNYKRPESLTEMMRRMIRQQMSEAAEASGAESFEEANDFEIASEDPEDSITPYQDLGSDEETPDATPGGVEPPAPQVQAAASTPAGGSEEPPAAPAQPIAGQSAGTATGTTA